MKQRILLFSLLILFGSVHAQITCNAGYESPLYAVPTPLNPNFIYLEQITVATPGTITALNANINGTAATQMKLALYESVNNVPGNLLFSTAALDVVSVPGTIVGNLTPSAIAAGTYFIGGTVNTTCSVLTCDGSASNLIYASTSDFNNPFPSNASTFMSVSGPVVNLWANIICGGNSVLEEAAAALTVNYNSSRNSISLRGATVSQAHVQLVSMEGKIIQSHQTSLVSSGTEWALPTLANGIYLVVVNVNGERLAAERVSIGN